MRVVILDSAEEMGNFAADIILRGVGEGSLKVLGVATGSSPLPIYQALRDRWTPAVANLEAFALDEYVGLPYSHPQSYHAVIAREVTESLGLGAHKVHVPDGGASDLANEGRRYEAQIASVGGIDLQILGIGSTGHIGFNEPTSSLTSRTRIKTLTTETRQDNARFFPSLDDVPRHCITQGLGTIMDARQVVLIAQGESKADAVANAVEGPLSSMCPGSILQMHQNATILLDSEAASKLKLIDYYRFVFANRPAWQQ